MNSPSSAAVNGVPESPYAWLRLWTAVLLGTIGSAGMWSVVVALPTVQAEFGVLRADASLPYTLTMLGFAVGGVAMGKLADRFGVVVPLAVGTVLVSAGYLLSSVAPSLFVFALIHIMIGAGSSATFAPLVADLSHWFTRRRGLAVGIVASGNYAAGAVWPPIVNYLISSYGWRPTQVMIGLFCLAASLPLLLLMRRRIAFAASAQMDADAAGARHALGISSNTLMALLFVAGIACCVAMSMPQVHIVAYCGDLGYGVARGAEMLSLMLGLGIVSRVASGFIADRIGGVATLLLGSFLQGVALFLYLFFDGLMSLYIVSAMFGLFQGGIVPMYAIIIRAYFPPQEAGTRVGIVIMATLFGMALGGWVSGVIFDYTGSYRAAFAHGLMWNLLNVAIASRLLFKSRPKGEAMPATPPSPARA